MEVSHDAAYYFSLLYGYIYTPAYHDTIYNNQIMELA
jgi:hypothetical protein